MTVSTSEIVQSGLRIVLIVIMAWLALHGVERGLRGARRHLVKRAGPDAPPGDAQRIETLARVLRYTFTVVLLVVALLMIMGALGISLAPLIATASVAGIAVGFGAQSLVKDYFTGFFLLVENQLRINDIVEVAGKTGVVEEITLRHVRLRDEEGKVHFVPNGLIGTVTNMTREFAWSVVDLQLPYACDLDRVFQMIRGVAAQMRKDPDFAKIILAEAEIDGVERFDASTVVVRTRLRVTAVEQGTIRREFLRRMKGALDQAAQTD
ncbi:MAG: mechanosensitive ion channel family protein [Betaproteobacteria bacterium]|nr:mechanosensitive ion channel family protein [Betaproteobacteria bacterium]